MRDSALPKLNASAFDGNVRAIAEVLAQQISGRFLTVNNPEGDIEFDVTKPAEYIGTVTVTFEYPGEDESESDGAEKATGPSRRELLGILKDAGVTIPHNASKSVLAEMVAELPPVAPPIEVP